MKKLSTLGMIIGASLLWATPVSLHWSPTKALQLSVDGAQAQIGRDRPYYDYGGYYPPYYAYAGYRRPYYGYGGYYRPYYAYAYAGYRRPPVDRRVAPMLQPVQQIRDFRGCRATPLVRVFRRQEEPCAFRVRPHVDRRRIAAPTGNTRCRTTSFGKGSCSPNWQYTISNDSFGKGSLPALASCHWSGAA